MALLTAVTSDSETREKVIGFGNIRREREREGERGRKRYKERGREGKRVRDRERHTNKM